MKLKHNILFFAGFILATLCNAQNTVTIGSEELNTKAVLRLVTPGGDQGFILPVVDNKNTINPGASENGMLVYESSTSAVFLWNGSEWVNITEGGSLSIAQLNEIGDVRADSPTEGQVLQFQAGVGWVAGDVALEDTDDQTALEVSYDNTASGLTATDVKTALDELAAVPPGSSIWKKDSENIYYNQGNVGIGTADPTSKLHLNIAAEDSTTARGIVIDNNFNGSTETYGVDIKVNGEATGLKIGNNVIVENGSGIKAGQSIQVDQQSPAIGYGQFIQLVSNNGDQVSAGISLTNGGTGTGDKYGILSAAGGQNSKNTGVYSFVQGGTGIGLHAVISNNAGNSTGVLSEISQNSSSISRGFHSKISEGGRKIGFDSEIVQDSEILNTYGVRSNIVNNNSVVEQYGFHSTILGSGGGDRFGLWSNIREGTGQKTGIYSTVRQGGGDQPSYGIYSNVIHQSSAPGYAFYSRIVGSSDLNGFYNSMVTSSGRLTAMTHELETNSSGSSLGNSVFIYGTGSGSRTSYYSRIVDGDNEKIGYESRITQDFPRTTIGFESTITDNSNKGSVGLRLRVVDNVSAGVAYGIQSIGDSLNTFDGSIKVGYQLSAPIVKVGSWHFRNDEANPPSLCVYSASRFMGFFSIDDGNYYGGSDRQLKTNIVDLEKVLASVMRLKPSRYQFKNNNANQSESIGFIAQDVKTLFPELVKVTDDTDYKELHTLNYNGFGVLAIKAIQEQQEIISNQEERIKSLEEQMRLLIKKIENQY